MPLQWRNQIWQSLEEGAGKRCSECASNHLNASVLLQSEFTAAQNNVEHDRYKIKIFKSAGSRG